MYDKPLRLLLFSFVLAWMSMGCLKVNKAYDGLAPGIWRGVLKLDPDAAMLERIVKEYPYYTKFDLEDRTEGELPFLMEVKYVGADSFYVEIINGEERIVVDHIVFGRDLATAKDTVVMHFPLWDTHIEAIVEENIMEGHWVVDYKSNYKVPFVAYFGKDYRFTTLRKPARIDLTGKWATIFSPMDSAKSFKGVGEFHQNENHLTGTFRTETGDYRFLEGTIQENKIYLSTFDGTHAYLFEGKIFENKSISGIFRSGKHYVTSWEASPLKEDNYLNSDDTLEANRNYKIPANMEFLDPEGRSINLNDPKFDDKIIVLQILGTWCPNCLDESRFLKEYLEHSAPDDVVVLGIAFERYQDTSRSLHSIRRYRENLGLPYSIVLGGTSTSKEIASQKLPFLAPLRAYPTLVVINREKTIEYIHTGFSGPATSKYEAFTENFEQLIFDLSDIP